jgi:hypothetical protein
MSSSRHADDDDSKDDDSKSEYRDTALGEALKEFEEAETRDVADSKRHARHDGEAGDALSPNEGAQEDASGS